VDHGVELHGLAQRGVCVAVYVAKKNPRQKKKLDTVDDGAELDATDHGAELFNPKKRAPEEVETP